MANGTRMINRLERRILAVNGLVDVAPSWFHSSSLPSEFSIRVGGPHGADERAQRPLARLQLMWRLRPTVILAAWWAWRAVRSTRSGLKVVGVSASVPDPPKLPRSAGIGVEAVLSRTLPTCLERALVAQRWLAAHGDSRDVVIGVMTGGTGAVADAHGGVVAHAWLDGEEPESAAVYSEMHRIAVR
jgi:hypothetical protein